MTRVLFVCLGNICRSPMAEAVFRNKVKRAGLEEKIEIDSAGTGHWHIGKPPHEGTVQKLKEKGISTQGLKARQVRADDLTNFDYIVAMDADNFSDLQAMAGSNQTGELSRLLDFHADIPETDVPDPYFTGNFDEVYDMVNISCERLLEHIQERENL